MDNKDYITKEYLDNTLKKMFVEFSDMILSVIEDQNRENQARFEAVIEHKMTSLK